MSEVRPELLSRPGSAGYRAGTAPLNSATTQQPAVVAKPRSAEEVAQVVRWAADQGLGVAVQASGHGAGAPIGSDQVLVDTSALTDMSIDPAARIAHVGAGTTWSALNSTAQHQGLFGLGGTSASVAIAGYIFNGGVGWLTRPYGMASSSLLAVDYVDGNGRLRRAAEDAAEGVDREALWAFRGGGGVGIATALTIELVAPQAIWAGFQLWDITALAAVTEAWSGAMGEVGDALATSISVLHAPPGPPFPPALRGVPVVHLAFASPAGPAAAAPLLTALRAAPPSALDNTWAPADAAQCAGASLGRGGSYCAGPADGPLPVTCCTGWSCDERLAACNRLPPTCPGGEVASVSNGCYGPCVPATHCAPIPCGTGCPHGWTCDSTGAVCRYPG